jgi:hypothetical protein
VNRIGRLLQESAPAQGMRAGAFDLKCTHTEQRTKPSTWLSTLGAAFWTNPFGLDDRGWVFIGGLFWNREWPISASTKKRKRPQQRGLGGGWGRPFQPPATLKRAANGQPNYRNSVDRSELVWSIPQLVGLFQFPNCAGAPSTPLPSWFLRLCWIPPCRRMHGIRAKKTRRREPAGS